MRLGKDRRLICSVCEKEISEYSPTFSEVTGEHKYEPDSCVVGSPHAHEMCMPYNPLNLPLELFEVGRVVR